MPLRDPLFSSRKEPLRIAVLTGAGMSAESGIPTFRDALTGFWSKYDPQRLATMEGFRSDVALVWGWYRWRAALTQRVQPHAGHHGLVQLEKRGHDVAIITQNVDDLHERAGSEQVLHLHGHLLRSRCAGCGKQRHPDPILLDFNTSPTEESREVPPRCDDCGDYFRPDVVWFGEMLPEAPWQEAQRIITNCELLVVIGTSGLVYPAAGLPAAAQSLRIPIIEINPMPSGISPLADEFWQLPAKLGVARLLKTLT
ncbi:MAG: NAD-dependent deacylase [Xanthomonadaceae bacterium]|jgi:NAD-dependent deacetylase|nr:NAD-dependent deacylase [Xanthomonadaceae bacterium]